MTTAINLFTSFGYFEDPADDLQVARNLHESLKPGGKLVMEMMGKEVLARRPALHRWRCSAGWRVFLMTRTPGGWWLWRRKNNQQP